MTDASGLTRMTHEQFMEYARNFNKQQMAIMNRKNVDYSTRGEEDVVRSHYEDVSQLAGVRPIQAAMVLMSKHITAVATFVRSGKLRDESIGSRLLDLANYCILMNALIDLQANDQQQEMEPPAPPEHAVVNLTEPSNIFKNDWNEAWTGNTVATEQANAAASAKAAVQAMAEAEMAVLKSGHVSYSIPPLPAKVAMGLDATEGARMVAGMTQEDMCSVVDMLCKDTEYARWFASVVEAYAAEHRIGRPWNPGDSEKNIAKLRDVCAATDKSPIGEICCMFAIRKGWTTSTFINALIKYLCTQGS